MQNHNYLEGLTDQATPIEQDDILADITVSYGEKIYGKGERVRPISLLAVCEKIRNDPGLSEQIAELRATADEEKQKELKKDLPYITFGTFKNNHRTNANLICIKHLVFDADKLGDDLERARSSINSDPDTFISFTSPRGNGIKTIEELDEPITDAATYTAVYKYHAEAFEKKHSVKLDWATVEPARATFLSSDEDLVINADRLFLPVEIPAEAAKKNKKGITKGEALVALKGAGAGKRNSYLTRLTTMLIDRGVEEDFALPLLKGWNLTNDPPLKETELARTVKALYVRYPHPANLERDFIYIRRNLEEKETEAVLIGKVYYDWLKSHEKAEFFTDENERHYVYVGSKLIPLEENNSDLMVLLLSTAELTTENPKGRIVVQVLNALAHQDGRRITKNHWLETHAENYTVFLNLRTETNELLKISPDACEVIQNGSNADDVFMLNTVQNKIKPIRFTQLDGAALKEALQTCHDLVVQHIPASEEDKWFLYAWRLSYPLYDFTTNHLTVRLQGPHNQGKSTASKVLSSSLYGDIFDSTSTVASLYRDASANPLIVEDNLENKRFYDTPDHGDFYLLAATGGSKQKSDMKSSSGVVIERIRALVLCNGIESIAKSEQTSRMMIVECNKDTYSSGYTSSVLLDIKRQRDAMLSAGFVLTQRVLKRMRNGDLQTVQRLLESTWKDHAKSRMFEHVATMVSYLEEFFLAAGIDKDVWTLVERWMTTQAQTAETEIVESDPIIQALDLIRDSAWKQMEYDKVHLGKDPNTLQERSRILKLDVQTLLATVTCDDTKATIEGCAGELVTSFAKVFQIHLNRQFNYGNGKILSQRIANIRKELEKHGYILTNGEDTHNHQKTYKFNYNWPKKQAA